MWYNTNGKRRGLVWGLSLGLALSGCTKIVELDLPEVPPQLVVNCVLNPDSLVRVSVSSSQSVYTNGAYPPVENATVQLYRDGQYLLDIPYQGRGRYQAPIRPQAAHTYELRLSAPLFPAVTATTRVLGAPALSDTQAKSAPPRLGQTLPTLDVSFVLADPADQDNYYYLRAFTNEPNRLAPGTTYRRAVSIDFVGPVKEEFSMEVRSFFSDKLFNGQALRVQLNLDTPSNQPVFLQVAQVPRSYYDYVRSLDKQSYRDNVFGQPVVVANNIIGGLGLFTSVHDTLL